MKFQIGTTVWLKTGSPSMTVKEVRSSFNEYLCTWYEDKTGLNEYCFSENQLTTENPLSVVIVSRHKRNNYFY